MFRSHSNNDIAFIYDSIDMNDNYFNMLGTT